MSDTVQSRFGVTAADLRRYDWQGCLAQCSDKQCYEFSGVFSGAAKELQAAGDDLGYRVFSFLGSIASLSSHYSAKGNPYGPMWRGGNGERSFDTEDLVDPDLAALSEVLNEIRDPEFRARVADVLWVTKRDFKAARVAVSAFVESAQRLKTAKSWPFYVDHLKRAASIAAFRGFEQERNLVVSVIEAAISECEADSTANPPCERLMPILLSLGEGDAVRYAALAERLAEAFAGKSEEHSSESYWKLAALWHRQAKNESDAQRCLLAAAECNISRGEAGLASPGQGALFAAHWVGCGLDALRRSRADPERIKVVHQRLLELQRLSLGEMKTIRAGVDVTPDFCEHQRQMQEASAAHVKGCDFHVAIDRFANVTKPCDVKQLKEQYAKISEKCIGHKIMGSTAIDHSGKVADSIPATGYGTPEQESVILRKHLYQNARIVDWPGKVAWMIEPARFALLEEHAIRLGDFLFLVENNPFIPPGHEGIYLRGLHAGFHGDWLVATHLLIPQIEASLRHVLQKRGVITSTKESDGTQKERDINQLLWLPEVEQFLGEDVLFDLRGILIEKFGCNLRNDLAHGLIHEGHFYQPVSEYLWWLILHMCWIGFIIAHPPVEESTVTKEGA